MSVFIPMARPTGRCFGSKSKTERMIPSTILSGNQAARQHV
jgi:hypothetical protein